MLFDVRGQCACVAKMAPEKSENKRKKAGSPTLAAKEGSWCGRMRLTDLTKAYEGANILEKK